MLSNDSLWHINFIIMISVCFKVIYGLTDRWRDRWMEGKMVWIDV